MSADVTLGSKVRWVSSSGGYTKEKVGVVVYLGKAFHGGYRNAVFPEDGWLLRNALSKLRTLELVEGGGEAVRAVDELF